MHQTMKPTVFGIKKLVYLPNVSFVSATTRVPLTHLITSGPWAILVLAAPAPKFFTITVRTFGVVHPDRQKKMVTVTSKSGTTCSCSLTALRTVFCIRYQRH